MQPQINAIKQLLATNNAIASQIEDKLTTLLGDRASWENCSTMTELTELEKFLWRSRIDLNDARINAEEVDLDEFLASLLEEQKQAKASLSGYLKSDEVIAERDRLIEHQREIIDGLAIASNLDAFKIAVDEAVNPALLAKIEECDRHIKRLEVQNESLAKKLIIADRKLSDAIDV